MQGQVAIPLACEPRAPTESEARTIARIMAASVTSEALRTAKQFNAEDQGASYKALSQNG